MAVLAGLVPRARVLVLAAAADTILERDGLRRKHTAANDAGVGAEIASVVGSNATWVNTDGLTPERTIDLVWNLLSESV